MFSILSGQKLLGWNSYSELKNCAEKNVICGFMTVPV